MDFKSTKIKYIPIDRLKHHPDNPRKDFGDLSELSDSIKKNGVFQNLTVVPSGENDGTYYVVIGNRRMEASKIAGLDELPCVISDMDKGKQVITMLAENMQRNDLNVYEQAFGFQLAMDLGESVSSLSEKSGFSVHTVKRRLKLAELDRDKLKQISDRQISMEDLDSLSRIEDIEERNRLLPDLGTSNFSYRLKNALADQRLRKVCEKWKKYFLESGLKEIPYNDVHSGKYASPNKQYVVLQTCSPEDYKLNGDEEFFSINHGTAYLRRERTAEELRIIEYQTTNNREKEYRCDMLAQIKKTCYELRRDFVFSVCESKAKQLFSTLVEMVMLPDWEKVLERSYYCRYIQSKFLNKDDSEERAHGFSYVEDIVKANPYQSLLRHAYVAMGDGENIGYHNRRGDHIQNDRLDKIYDVLESLGYEMAEDERHYKDGSHRFFKKEDENDAG